MAGISTILLAQFLACALWRVFPGWKSYSKPLIFLLGLLLVKLTCLLYVQGLWWDVGCYTSWAQDMATYGAAHVYEPHPDSAPWTVGHLYTPGAMYFFWGTGSICQYFNLGGDFCRMVICSPPLLADLGLGLLFFILGSRLGGAQYGWLMMLCFALNPGLLYDTTYWLQSDSIVVFLMLLSVMLLIDKHWALGWGVLALGFLIKPQAAGIGPILAAWTIPRASKKDYWYIIVTSVTVLVITVLPFQLIQPLTWLPKLFADTASQNQEASVNAFNLWAILAGMRTPDYSTIAGFTIKNIGMFLSVVFYILVVFAFVRSPQRSRDVFFFSFLALLGAFLVAPEMHERYIYPAGVFVVALALDSPLMFTLFIAFSELILVHLAYVLQIIEMGKNLPTHDTFAVTMALVNFGLFIAFSVVGTRENK